MSFCLEFTPESREADLKKIEDLLYSLSAKSIRQFASEHPNESFYGFGFDCNSEYGDVLLCANTEADFQKTAQEYIKKWDYTEENLADLKKNYGDWKYQGFNVSHTHWDEKWRPVSSAIEDFVFSEETDEQGAAFLDELMRCFTRALLRLEADGIISELKQDEGFVISIFDHDEREEAAEKRLSESVEAFRKMELDTIKE